MILVDGFRDYLSTLYPQASSWLLAQVSRDFLLFDALPEEVFYRAFMIALLSIGFKSVVEFGRFKISHAALLSVPLFAFAHVQVSLFPFAIIQYDMVQLILTMFTGLLFAYAYEKTECLVVPILLHGYTNLVITVSAYVVLLFL